MSSNTPSESSSSHGGSQDSANWSLNHRIVPPWYERLTCRCGHVAIVDIWEHDGTDRARRLFFKCPDLDPDFVVQYFYFLFLFL
jgi:hypothetical protein